MSKDQTQKVWMSRCKPGGKHDQLDDCKRDGIIAIGWGHVDLSQQNWWESDEGKALGGHARGNLRRFREMRKGDWVVVPRGPELHFAQITDGKVANAEKAWAGGRVSYYEADWQDGTRKRSKMPASVQRRLRYRGTHLDLHGDYEQLHESYGKSIFSRMVEELQQLFEKPESSNLNPDKLEEMVKQLFVRMQFKLVQIPGKKQSKPGDVDIEAVMPLGIPVYAQVKYHQGTSGAKGIEQLILRKAADSNAGEGGEKFDGGLYIFITTAKKIDQEARDKAERADIVCWDGTELAAALVEYGIVGD